MTLDTGYNKKSTKEQSLISQFSGSKNTSTTNGTKTMFPNAYEKSAKVELNELFEDIEIETGTRKRK